MAMQQEANSVPAVGVPTPKEVRVCMIEDVWHLT